MKKLLLLLLCVPLIGLGQNKNYTNEEISLLLKLNLCITDSNNNPDNLPICYDDDYSIYTLKDYLVVFLEDRKNYGEWCGSMGCAIIIFKENERNYEEIFWDNGWYIESNPQYILYKKREGNEEFIIKITIINNQIRFIEE